jgi:hypothetical protein
VTGTVYVVGVPGSGKTTALLAARALRGWEHLADEKLPLRHQLWATTAGEWVHQLGWTRPTDQLAGTDTLQLDAQPLVRAWLADAEHRPTWLVGEGDRLATNGFCQAAVEAGHLRLLWLDTPRELAAERLAQRGAVQAPAWWRGRATKVARLVERWDPERIDGSQPAELVAAEVARCLP